MKEPIPSLFGSKKFIMTLAGVAVWGIGQATSFDVTQVLQLIGLYVGAQGVADWGKESVKEGRKPWRSPTAPLNPDDIDTLDQPLP